MRDLFILGCGLRNFLAASSTTMESLTLKVLDFGLQMPTGPSSRVVACILLVSSRLDCPGISLAELCATCLEMSMWSFSGGVTLKCCSSNFLFQKTSINIRLRCYPIIFMQKKQPISCSTNLQSENFNKDHYKKKYCLQNGNGYNFYKFQNIITFERSKKPIKWHIQR